MDSNLAYREEFREELVGGKVLLMSPASSNHNRIAWDLFAIFHHYLKGKRCEPFGDGEDLYLTEEDRFVPDFMVVCDPDKVKADGVYGAPDLVVEVLSPSTARNDKIRKKQVYGQCGVREYWMIHPEDKSIEIYYPGGTGLELHDVYTLFPDWELARMTPEKRAAVETHNKCSLFDDLEISLADIFYRTF